MLTMAERTIKFYSVHTARFNITYERVKHPPKTSGPFDIEQLIEELT